MNPKDLGLTPPPTVAKIDMEVNSLQADDCRVRPSGSASVMVGGLEGWKLVNTKPDEYQLTAMTVKVFYRNVCISLIAYFGLQSHDQSTFDRIVDSLQFTGTT
jgi:hypothetical protein